MDGRPGLVHTYQRYDPTRFPSPTAPPPDLTSAAFEHMLRHGSTRELTPEELARAVRLDPSMIAGLGPSLDTLIALLEERKRKILETYETERARRAGRQALERAAVAAKPPAALRERFERAIRDEQLRDLERLWYQAERTDPGFAVRLLAATEAMGATYEIEAMGSRWAFTGREPLDLEHALAIKEELETIDKLLEQLREALRTAQIRIVDLDELAQFVQEADVDQLRALQEQVQRFVRDEAERQGLDLSSGRVDLTPRAYRIFQGRLLDEIFADLDAARSGRHNGPVGEGAVETARTRAYAFGDSPASMDVTQTLINAMLREGVAHRPPDGGAGGSGGGSRAAPVRVRPADIEVHETRNTPKCATCVLVEMSGSMRHGGQYVHCKRMALALDGLIRREFPGDFLRTIEVFSLARVVPPGEIAALMPKPVTLFDPVVRLKADMSRPEITESMIPPHFTNIQHGLRLARQMLGVQDTPNRQVVLITDGLPTAHFDGSELFLLYPPDPLTERATMREALACAREGITINIFLLPSWNQSEEDVRFAQRLAETTRGRVFFTGGRDLDRFVLWDYVRNRRAVIG